ncbi:GNAT family N-acetyltransferase [Stackebrandtia soli]|uniref:GNAT family N-acetyltransferase n=1 Tax=Stackebrandtia soli TaxID=1892856 RepID=UPI0039E94470
MTTTPWTALTVEHMTAAHAADIATWRYDGPWAVYDPGEPPVPTDDYRVVLDEERAVVGFCCLGAEARVPGLAEDPGLIDVGVGLAPRHVHHGYGRAFASVVLDWARSHAAPKDPDSIRLRAVVKDWNTPSLRLTRALGFSESGHHRCEQDGAVVTYVVMTTAS